MRIVIIGGTGFIGGAALRQLRARNHEITAIQRHRAPGLEVRQIECEQQELRAIAVELRKIGADVVIDFVSSSARQARATTEVFAGHAAHLVTISSQDVYKAFGIFHGTEKGLLEPVPLTEDSALRTNRNLYSTEMLEQMQRRFGWVTSDYSNVEMEEAVLKAPALRCTVVRLPMVYGPGDYLHRLFPILKRIDDGRRAIPIADTLAAWRAPRGYVEDVAWAVVLAAENPSYRNRIYNIAEAQSFSELEWTKLVAQAAGWSGDIITLPFAEAPAHLRLPGNHAQHGNSSSDRIRKELGYQELTPRAEGLARTIAWERAHPPEPLPQFDYAAEDAALERHASAAAQGAQ